MPAGEVCGLTELLFDRTPHGSWLGRGAKNHDHGKLHVRPCGESPHFARSFFVHYQLLQRTHGQNWDDVYVRQQRQHPDQDQLHGHHQLRLGLREPADHRHVAGHPGAPLPSNTTPSAGASHQSTRTTETTSSKKQTPPGVLLAAMSGHRTSRSRWPCFASGHGLGCSAV